MKKILVLIISVTLFGCNQIDDQENVIDSDNTKFEKIIPSSKAVGLYKNDEHRLNLLGINNLSIEKKASYFDLGKLKSYVNNLDDISKKYNVDISGVNFVYGSDSNSQRTVFLTPSVYNSDLDYNESFTIESNKIIPFIQIKDNLMKLNSSKIQEELILSENGFISYNEATALFNSFQYNYIEPIKKIVKKEYYTKSMWYSLKEIKNYLLHLEQVSTKKNAQIKGVNLFFGVYKSDKDLKYPNSQTLFLMPSISKIESKTVNSYDDFKFLIENFSKNEKVILDGYIEFANEANLAPPPK